MAEPTMPRTYTSTTTAVSLVRSLRRLSLRKVRVPVITVLGLALLAIEPAAAQSAGGETATAFCNTAMAQTAKNIFTVIQFGGPLIGGVVALGATVMMPVVRRADFKKEFKETRNQALIWGVIVAPLATVILQFLLNNVVVGGVSCGF